MKLDFAEVVNENQSMVFSIALRFMRDRGVAEELAQDVFVQIHRQLSHLESPVHATGWLRRAICHRCIDEIRKRQLRVSVALDSVAEPAVEDPGRDTLLNERIRRLIALLPEAARMVMILRYQEDLDPADISGVLNMPIGTVKSHLHRSLAVLREKLEKQEVGR